MCLPEELLEWIVAELSIADRLSLSQVSKRFNVILSRGTFWKNVSICQRRIEEIDLMSVLLTKFQNFNRFLPRYLNEKSCLNLERYVFTAVVLRSPKNIEALENLLNEKCELQKVILKECDVAQFTELVKYIQVCVQKILRHFYRRIKVIEISKGTLNKKVEEILELVGRDPYMNIARIELCGVNVTVISDPVLCNSLISVESVVIKDCLLTFRQWRVFFRLVSNWSYKKLRNLKLIYECSRSSSLQSTSSALVASALTQLITVELGRKTLSIMQNVALCEEILASKDQKMILLKIQGFQFSSVCPKLVARAICKIKSVDLSQAFVSFNHCYNLFLELAHLGKSKMIIENLKMKLLYPAGLSTSEFLTMYKSLKNWQFEQFAVSEKEWEELKIGFVVNDISQIAIENFKTAYNQYVCLV